MLADPSILWSKNLGTRLRGLSLAREKGNLLAWDQNHWLYLVNDAGEKQGQVRLEEPLAAAAISDDGSALAIAGQHGLVRWLNPDLTPRWQRSLNLPLLALALDPLGDFLVLADNKGGVHFFSRAGKLAGQFLSSRPLHHLAFVAAAPMVVGSSDFGLVGAFDLCGRWLWRDAPVVNAGSLAVNGDGSATLLACFSEGLYHYGPQGQQFDRLILPEPCSLVAVSFLDDLILAAGMDNTLYFLSRPDNQRSQLTLEKPTQALALGALGRTAFVILKDGHLLRLKVTLENPS